MEENKQQNMPTIQINAQYIKDLSFEAPALPFALSGLKTAPKITIDIDVKVNKAPSDNVYTVDLITSIKAVKSDEDKTLFLCELTYGGLVTLNLPKEQVEPVLLIEIPHLLFPYVRSIIANITRESGLPPLQINPIDFASLYREKLKNQSVKKES